MRWWPLLKRPPILNVAYDHGEGPVVVLIHGIASSSVTFQNVVPLIEPRHRVVSIDLLGFGGSPIVDDCNYTLADHTEAIRRTITSLRLSEPETTAIGRSG